MRRHPKTPQEWQDAVDAAAGARMIADCMMYGIITGPDIDVRRCDGILERGRKRGVTPSRPADEIALDLIRAINEEQSI